VKSDDIKPAFDRAVDFGAMTFVNGVDSLLIPAASILRQRPKAESSGYPTPRAVKSEVRISD